MSESAGTLEGEAEVARASAELVAVARAAPEQEVAVLEQVATAAVPERAAREVTAAAPVAREVPEGTGVPAALVPQARAAPRG